MAPILHSICKQTLLVLFAAPCIGGIRRSASNSQRTSRRDSHIGLAEQSIIAKPVSDTGKFSFTLINNSTLPLNILALPKLITLYSESRNNLMPGEKFSFLPGMGAYDFHAVIHDGLNTWNNVGEATWGLTKAGTSYMVSVAAGAGTSGAIAVAATAFVTAALTTVVAPAALVYIGLATFWGTAVVSSMTVSAVTNNAMDFVKDHMTRLAKNNPYELEQLNELEGLSSKPGDHPDRLLRLSDVVPDESVLAAFRLCYPGVDVNHVLTTRRHAEAYFSAMVSEFTYWSWAKGFNRQFILQGGFSAPMPLGSTTWSKTTFEGLKFGEILRSRQGLCQKSLVIRYTTVEGEKGETRIQSDWEQVLVAEKTFPGTHADQDCKKQYVAMCELSNLRLIKLCRLNDLQNVGVNSTVWDEYGVEDRSLAWMTRKTSLQKGEQKLHLLVPNSLGNEVNMKTIAVSHAQPE